LLITIDGPSGAGKSTVARALARALGFAHLDSGAMYRSVALLALADPDADPAQLARDARIEVEPEAGEAGVGERVSARVLVNGRDVTERIRTPAVSEAASAVARDPAVREALVAKQRALIAGGDWVVEGRDIGTVVAPGAELKIFLTADASERARRRAGELGADTGAVLAEQARRDERDSSREHSPLRAAPGAVVLDTTSITVAQAVERIAALARAATAADPGWASESSAPIGCMRRSYWPR
jgi:cytidylate kinase